MASWLWELLEEEPKEEEEEDLLLCWEYEDGYLHAFLLRFAPQQAEYKKDIIRQFI